MSLPFRVSDAVDWTRGRLLRGNPDHELEGASIDTRATAPGQLFVAIVGPNHDAHDFLSDAAAAGAGGLLVQADRALPRDLPPELPVIAVDDTTTALGALARGHRADFDGPVVAITGSNGKTTTKEMCAAIMQVSGACLRNAGNLNNQFGLPLTLLRRDARDRALVIELGMNHRGEIAALRDIAQPTVGVITNVGTAHIEHLGSTEEIALEKGDLVAGLATDATAVLNADDPLVAAQAERSEARVLRYGTASGADVRAENPRSGDGNSCSFELVTAAGRRSVRVAGLGETAWRNALAAAAAALAAGADLDQIVTGLARHEPVRGRLARIELAGGAELIDDSYNANPQSMTVALRLLAERAGSGRSFAVIGDMGELGDTAPAAHREAGAAAAALGIAYLFALGDRAEDVVTGATDAGMAADRATVARNHEDVAMRVRELVGPDDCVLIKGSRAMKMERVVELLSAEPPATLGRA